MLGIHTTIIQIKWTQDGESINSTKNEMIRKQDVWLIKMMHTKYGDKKRTLIFIFILNLLNVAAMSEERSNRILKCFTLMNENIMWYTS